MFSKRSVLLVDFDPQANLTKALLTQANMLDVIGRAESYNLAFSYEALLQGREPLAYPVSGVDNLYIVAMLVGSVWLQNVIPAGGLWGRRSSL